MSVSAAPRVNWDEISVSLLGQRNARILPPWVKLPSLPSAVMECVRLSQDPEVAPADFARAIEKDSGLTCILLRHVNSAAAGFSFKAGTALEAVTRMGIRSTMLFLLTTGLNEVMKTCNSRLVNFQSFWCSNLERALFARHVARLLRTDAELAFAGAMLSDCLLPLLTNKACTTYLRFVKLQEQAPRPLTEFEDKEFGWNHCTATALLLAGWNFPSDLVCCVYLHHKGLGVLKDPQLADTAAAAVAVAGLLPDQLHQAPDGPKLLQVLQSSWPEFSLQDVAEAVQLEFDEFAPGVENPLPLVERLGRPR